MTRGIGNRQKKIVAPKKVWIRPSFSLSSRERAGVRGRKKTKTESKAPPGPGNSPPTEEET